MLSLKLSLQKNFVPWWTRFCSFKKPDTMDEIFLSKVDLWLSPDPRKHEKYQFLKNLRYFWCRMMLLSLFLCVFCIKKIFKQKFLNKTVVHAITIRLLSKLKKFQRYRTRIFCYHVRRSENNGFEENRALFDKWL